MSYKNRGDKVLLWCVTSHASECCENSRWSRHVVVVGPVISLILFLYGGCLQLRERWLDDVIAFEECVIAHVRVAFGEPEGAFASRAFSFGDEEDDDGGDGDGDEYKHDDESDKQCVALARLRLEPVLTPRPLPPVHARAPVRPLRVLTLTAIAAECRVDVSVGTLVDIIRAVVAGVTIRTVAVEAADCVDALHFRCAVLANRFALVDVKVAAIALETAVTLAFEVRVKVEAVTVITKHFTLLFAFVDGDVTVCSAVPSVLTLAFVTVYTVHARANVLARVRRALVNFRLAVFTHISGSGAVALVVVDAVQAEAVVMARLRRTFVNLNVTRVALVTSPSTLALVIVHQINAPSLPTRVRTAVVDVDVTCDTHISGCVAVARERVDVISATSVVEAGL